MEGEGDWFLGSMDGSGVCMVWGLWMEVMRCVGSEDVVRQGLLYASVGMNEDTQHL